MEATTVNKRSFVVRLDTGGGDELYDLLKEESYRKSKTERRQVAMTEIVRDALRAYLGAAA